VVVDVTDAANLLSLPAGNGFPGSGTGVAGGSWPPDASPDAGHRPRDLRDPGHHGTGYHCDADDHGTDDEGRERARYGGAEQTVGDLCHHPAEQRREG
jgi:hypothetical protein